MGDLQTKSEALHQNWRFLTFIHFIEQFREQLGVPQEMTIPDLEMAVITVNRSQTLVDLLVCLLKHLRCSVSVNPQSWYRVLNIVLNRRNHCFEDGNPIRDVFEDEFFSEVSLDDKVIVLQYLCEWALEESQ